MAQIRVVVFITAVVFLIGSVLSFGTSHDLILGRIDYRDRLIEFQVVSVPSKFLRVVTKEVKFPTGYPSSIINYIGIKDLKRDGTGGYATVTAGGLGQRQVTVRFKSQRNHGIHFNVTLYGSY